MATVALLAGALLLAVPVGAHARFISANLGPGIVVQELPPRLDMVFSQNVQSATVSVQGPGGVVAGGGGLTKDGSRTSVGLRSAGNGLYRVSWSTVSAEDGEEAKGGWEFGVGTPGSISPSKKLTEEADEHDQRPWPLIAGGAILLIGVAAYVFYRRRQRSAA